MQDIPLPLLQMLIADITITQLAEIAAQLALLTHIVGIIAQTDIKILETMPAQAIVISCTRCTSMAHRCVPTCWLS